MNSARPTVREWPISRSLLVGNRGILLAICLLSNVFAGLISTLMAAYLPDAVQELAGSSDPATMGHVGAYIGSLFLVGWALGGISFGWSADRFGRARMFTMSVIVFAAASVAASVSPNWQILVALRLAAGVGIGGTMVVSAILIAEACEERARAIALGFMGVSYPMGIIAAGAISFAVTDWRAGFLVGLLPLTLGGLAVLVVRESGHWLSERSRTATTIRPSRFGTLISPAHRRDFLIGATIFGTMSVGLWATFSWLPAWAESLLGPTGDGQQQRGMLMMVLGGGGIVGGAFSGFLSNGLGRRRTLLIAFAGAFLGSALLFRTTTMLSPLVFAETAFLAIFFGIGQGTLTGYIPELFPTGVRATATGVCFNVGRVATALAVFFVGVLVPVLGGYGESIAIFSVMYLFGFAATLLGKETRSAAGVPVLSTGTNPQPTIDPV